MNESLKLLSDLTFYMKYSKYNPEKKRREMWIETVTRNKDMHLKKFPECSAEIEKAYELILAKKILPSMRSMQFGGEAIDRNNARMYNCAAVGLDSLGAFADLFYLLLCGSGVGFSVRRNFISRLPNLAPRSGKKTVFTPDDSIEGWADCMRAIAGAYFEAGNDLEFDFSKIRPKGALIHSSMCAAPGPGPLKATCENLQNLLDRKIAENDMVLTSLDCYDMCCFISEAVLSGGVRRSAMMCLFDKDDDLMLHAKEGEWWKTNPQRGLANNSVQFDRETTTKEEFDAIFAQTEKSGCGEPGVVWTNNPDWLVNPCCEISMPSHGFCNLTSVNLGTIESQEDFNERAYYAAVVGTLQAAYTDFIYIDSQWKKNADGMRLIGVSLTGIAAHQDLSKINFEQAVAAVKKANKDIADKIGIQTGDRLTTIKPDGTGSLVLGTSSGIHPWHAKHYIRRLRVNKLEPLYDYMSKNFPDLIEDEQANPDKNGVLSLVIKAPEGAITRRSQTAIEFLERVKYMFEHWIKPGHVRGDNYNNVSCTCNVKNHEWMAVREWMWANRNNYTGISLLPYSDSSYVQAPMEDTNEEAYKAFGEKGREFHLDQIEEEKNFVNFGVEAACAGSACEVV